MTDIKTLKTFRKLLIGSIEYIHDQRLHVCKLQIQIEFHCKPETERKGTEEFSKISTYREYNLRIYREEYYLRSANFVEQTISNVPGACCKASIGDRRWLRALISSTRSPYFCVIFSSAPHAAIILRLDSASAAKPAASRSSVCTLACLFATSGVKIEYHMAIASRPHEVTSVSSQLKQHPMMSAMDITAVACIKDDRRSDMPSCSIFAVTVMMAVVCPGGSASKVDIGNRKSSRR